LSRGVLFAIGESQSAAVEQPFHARALFLATVTEVLHFFVSRCSARSWRGRNPSLPWNYHKIVDGRSRSRSFESARGNLLPRWASTNSRDDYFSK